MVSSKNFSYLLIFLLACKSKDPLLTAKLEITVIDTQAFPQENVSITLYKNKKDWNIESNAVTEEKFSNSLGKISFFNLDGGIYYINAVKDSLNNWEDRIKTELTAARFGFKNIEYTIISFSVSGIISNSDGKYWKIKEVNINNQVDENSCIKNNVYIFYKSGKYLLIRDEQNCKQNEQINLEGSWSLNNFKTKIIFSYDDKEKFLEIIEIEKEKFKVQQIIEGEVAIVTYQMQE